MKDQASTGTTTPYTGAEFLESLQDGRNVYIHGERVKDVTPAPRITQLLADGGALV